MYHITVKPPWDRPYRKRDTELYFEVFAKWKQMVPVVKSRPQAWVFNGNNIIYSTKDVTKIQDVEEIRIKGDNQETLPAQNYIDRVGYWAGLEPAS